MLHQDTLEIRGICLTCCWPVLVESVVETVRLIAAVEEHKIILLRCQFVASFISVLFVLVQ